jgi:hypothetical protein
MPDVLTRQPMRPAWPLLLAGTLILTAPLIHATAAFPPAARAQSNLLEAVKRDPGRARKLCRQLRDFNQQGLSYTSKRALQEIASQENLSLMDAEVLTTYVVGLHCPDVR